jgi:hypothetical protein
MKILLSTVLLSLASSTYSFTGHPIRRIVKKMTFVPASTITVPDSVGKPKEIKFAPFYVGNQVTNIEYREFLESLKANPDRKLVKVVRDEKVNGPDTAHVVTHYKNALLVSAPTGMLPTPDYFTSPKYDNYPVTGISPEGKRYFALWKTKQERDLPRNIAGPVYMLPTPQQQFLLQSRKLEPLSKAGKRLLDSDIKIEPFYLIVYAPTRVSH